MDQMGIKRLARDIVAKAEKMKLSKGSIRKMKKWSQDKYLPRLIVQAGSVSEPGRKFCIGTYGAEGKDPLPFGIYMTFDELDRYVSSPFVFGDDSLTRKRCKEASGLVQPKWQLLSQEVTAAKVTAELIQLDVYFLEEDLASFATARREEQEQREVDAQPQRQSMGRGRRVRVPKKQWADNEEEESTRVANVEEEEEEVEDTEVERAEKLEVLVLRRQDLQGAKEVVNVKEEMLAEFESEYGNILTEDDFVNYAKSCVKGAFDKYRELFSEDEDLVRVRKAFRACKVFDILFLRSGPSIESLERMIDELVHFELEELDDDFLKSLKKEIPKLLKLVRYGGLGISIADPGSC